MTFKPRIWHPIALGLTALNLVAVGPAAGAAEPWHATTHAALALAFGFWALRLRRATRGGELSDRLDDRLDTHEALGALEAEVGDLRRELGEAQERLDFAERLMAQGLDARRAGPDR